MAAYKSAIREQKLNMVMSAAKREKDFYLSKVEKSRAMTEIDERMKRVLTLFEGTVLIFLPPSGCLTGLFFFYV